jgi:hypothetical protein
MNVDDRLEELLRAHGVTPKRDGEWFVFGSLRMQTALFVHEGATRSVQLDVRLVPWIGARLVESFGGFGASIEEATRNAFENFVRSSFHVLLAAFHGMKDDQVTIESWDIGNVVREVTLGKIVSRVLQRAPLPRPPRRPRRERGRRADDRACLP